MTDTKKTDNNFLIKRLLLFYTIDIGLNFIVLFLYRNVTSPTPLQGLTLISIPFILTIALVRTKDGMTRQTTAQLVTTLLVVNCIAIVVINLINPFGRLITTVDYQNGIFRDVTNHLLIFIPLSIVLGVIVRKRKKISDTNYNMDKPSRD
ncbi:MAG: hypothetical protein K0S32_2540 [Bacteroidetes bacterium]|jgi:hypothetical protein|nr:hypothetical protein [Bacteroidota bacterium]